MTFKLFNSIFTGYILFMSHFANAGLIHTYGNLTSNTDEDFITDTSIGRQYLRFDEFDLSYAETLASISQGGIYEGWNIATSVINDDFISALFGGGDKKCPISTIVIECGVLTAWQDGVFGDSYNADSDYFAYISDVGPHLFGGTSIQADSGLVAKHDALFIAAGLDTYNEGYGRDINLLLYRDSVESVPEPSTLLIFALGVAGVGLRRFNK